MAYPNLGDLVATTARKFTRDIQNNVLLDNGLLNFLKDKGKVKGGVSGRTLVDPFIYGDNSSVQWYSGYDTFTPPTTQQVFDGAEYQWKQLGGFISISGRDRKMNRGKEEQFSFFKTRLKQIKSQLKNTLGLSLYSDGTGSGGKEIGGLQLLVADNPTAAGTVGGINQVTYSWWRNKYSAAASTTASNIRGRMNSMWLEIKRESDVPDVWAADSYMYELYWEALQDLQRIMSAESGDSGYKNLYFKGAPVIYDGRCPTKHMYALNTEEIALTANSDAEDTFFEVGDARQVTNADYEVVPIWFMGTMHTGRRAGHGVIIAS